MSKEEKKLDFIACKNFFESNKCDGNCKFSHDPEVWKKNKSTKKIPCMKYFGLMEGKCTFGNFCLYSHDYQDCAKRACPRFFGLNGHEKNSCDSVLCPFSHQTGDGKTFQDDQDREIKASGILLYKIVDDVKLFFLVNEGEFFSEPGGKLSITDESSLCGARREFEEETGTKCPFWDFEGNIHYLEKAKYLMHVKKVSSDFHLPSSKAIFMELNENIKLHPRSQDFILSI